MQTAALEAVVYAGGPLTAQVDRWLCGWSDRQVFVRVIFVQYPDLPDPDDRRTHDDLIPVVFEDGRYAAFGWAALRREPGRYGVRLSLPGEPWRTPPGWLLLHH